MDPVNRATYFTHTKRVFALSKGRQEPLKVDMRQQNRQCDWVMKLPALTPLCLCSGRWRSACLSDSVGEKRGRRGTMRDGVSECGETSTTPPKVFFPHGFLGEPQRCLKKGGEGLVGQEVVDKMFLKNGGSHEKPVG